MKNIKFTKAIKTSVIFYDSNIEETMLLNILEILEITTDSILLPAPTLYEISNMLALASKRNRLGKFTLKHKCLFKKEAQPR